MGNYPCKGQPASAVSTTPHIAKPSRTRPTMIMAKVHPKDSVGEILVSRANFGANSVARKVALGAVELAPPLASQGPGPGMAVFGMFPMTDALRSC